MNPVQYRALVLSRVKWIQDRPVPRTLVLWGCCKVRISHKRPPNALLYVTIYNKLTLVKFGLQGRWLPSSIFSIPISEFHVTSCTPTRCTRSSHLANHCVIVFTTPLVSRPLLIIKRFGNWPSFPEAPSTLYKRSPHRAAVRSDPCNII
jgi:hypothetical protein